MKNFWMIGALLLSVLPACNRERQDTAMGYRFLMLAQAEVVCSENGKVIGDGIIRKVYPDNSILLDEFGRDFVTITKPQCQVIVANTN